MSNIFNTADAKQVTLVEVQDFIQNQFKDASEFKTKDARSAITEQFNITDKNELSRAVYYSVQKNDLTYIERIKKGTYVLTNNNSTQQQTSVNNASDEYEMKMTTVIPSEIAVVDNIHPEENFVPEVNKTYVPHGCHSIVRKVIKNSNVFAPVWITGEAGNGKTYGVEQACAKEKRECIVVNISNETTEEDLIGSYIIKSENVYEVEVNEEDYNKMKELGII